MKNKELIKILKKFPADSIVKIQDCGGDIDILNVQSGYGELEIPIIIGQNIGT